jgi:hypothetical protein
MVGASDSSNAVSGRSIFGKTDTPATAISRNKEAARSRDDMGKPQLQRTLCPEREIVNHKGGRQRCEKTGFPVAIQNCAQTPISLSRAESSPPGARVRKPSPRWGHQSILRFLGMFEICDGRAARWGGFFVDPVTRENNCYILMVTGSVSVKLRADSAGRTISFSPV